AGLAVVPAGLGVLAEADLVFFQLITQAAPGDARFEKAKDPIFFPVKAIVGAQSFTGYQIFGGGLKMAVAIKAHILVVKLQAPVAQLIGAVGVGARQFPI